MAAFDLQTTINIIKFVARSKMMEHNNVSRNV